jgi:hypothetical protein
MKGRLISVNFIPHAYSETLSAAFEVSIQDRAELWKSDWLGCECMFNIHNNQAEIIPDSIIPAGKKAELSQIMNLITYDDMDSDEKIEAVKEYIHNHF